MKLHYKTNYPTNPLPYPIYRRYPMPSNTKNRQWRQNKKIAIQRATRLSENLEQMLFVIYDNENERYDIVNEDDLYHLIEEFDLDMNIVAEVG